MPDVTYETIDKYHEDFSRISATMLKLFKRSRPEYYETYVAKPPTMERKRSTKAMETGSIVHEIVLMQKTPRSVVCILPDPVPILYKLNHNPRLTGPGRDRLSESEVSEAIKLIGCTRDEFFAAKGGKELKALCARAGRNVIGETGIVNKKDLETFKMLPGNQAYKYFVSRKKYEDIQNCVRSLRSSDINQVLEGEGVEAEKVFTWTDPDTGLNCRSCVDFIKEKKSYAMIADLKVTTFADRFEKAYNDALWWIQEAHYRSGVEHTTGKSTDFMFVCHRPERPYYTTEGRVSEDDLVEVQASYKQLMRDLFECYRTGDWRDPSQKSVQVSKFWRRNHVESTS